MTNGKCGLSKHSLRRPSVTLAGHFICYKHCAICSIYSPWSDCWL